MNPFAPNESLKNSDPRCADFMTIAEQELSAFFNAVTQLFGSEQAELSAEDWLRELDEIDGLPASTREWRLLTTKVSTRFASRLTTPRLTSSKPASSLSTEFTTA
jgi:hypothetical protein